MKISYTWKIDGKYSFHIIWPELFGSLLKYFPLFVGSNDLGSHFACMDSRFSSKSSAHSAAMLPTINGLNGDGDASLSMWKEWAVDIYSLKRNEAWDFYLDLLLEESTVRRFLCGPKILLNLLEVLGFLRFASEWSRDSQEAQYLLLPLAAEGSLACFLALLGGLVA